MALSFPLTRPNFMDKLPVEQMTLDLPTAREVAISRGGTIYSAEVGEQIWSGSITLAPMKRAEGQEVRTLLTALEVPGREFQLYDLTRPYPLSDPDGSNLVGNPTTISAHTTSTLTIDGLPNGYEITVGDYVSYSNGGRRYLHVFTEGATVAGGSTGAIEVQPFVRGTISGGTSCTFAKPFCNVITVPGSVNFGQYQAAMTYGISFKFRQLLGS